MNFNFEWFSVLLVCDGPPNISSMIGAAIDLIYCAQRSWKLLSLSLWSFSLQAKLCSSLFCATATPDYIATTLETPWANLVFSPRKMMTKSMAEHSWFLYWLAHYWKKQMMQSGLCIESRILSLSLMTQVVCFICLLPNVTHAGFIFVLLFRSCYHKTTLGCSISQRKVAWTPGMFNLITSRAVGHTVNDQEMITFGGSENSNECKLCYNLICAVLLTTISLQTTAGGKNTSQLNVSIGWGWGIQSNTS